MAILGLLRAQIVVNEAPCLEHNYNDPGASHQDYSITKYLQVQPSTSFGIRISSLEGYIFPSDIIGFKLQIDGQDLPGVIMSKEYFESISSAPVTLTGTMDDLDGVYGEISTI